MRSLKIIQNTQTFFLPYEEGDTVLRVLQKNGFSLSASCGGKGTCGHCMVYVNGVLQKSCLTTAEENMTIVLPSDSFSPKIEILPQSASSHSVSSDCHYGVAVDIGTITIALALVHLADKTICASCGCQNPGIIYGADVLSRMEASNHGLCLELQENLRSCLSREITALLAQNTIPLSQLDQICIAANTPMCHLLLGLSCRRLGQAPFHPVMLNYPPLSAKDFLGRDFASSTRIRILPGISAFLGGDISSGLFALDFPDKNSYSLFIDLGTNGEMVLGNHSRIFGTSVAAGPAFEGSRIPGSDVLSAIHEMLQKKALDQTGLLQGIFFHTGYAYQKYCFTQEDIRSIQLAKASVRAGIETLLAAADIRDTDVSEIFLCGGFGTHTQPDQAAAIGMLPQSFLGRIHSKGNTSLLGAVRYLLSPSESYFEKLQKKTEILELSSSAFYREQYIKWMNFL